MHGCGNDYIYVNGFEETVPAPSAVAVRLSDRHFGVGGDGLILIEPSERADFRMRMFNADGSEAEMCGNGIRCLAKYVYDRGLTDRTTLAVETGAGIKELALSIADGKVDRVRVGMGTPRLDRAEVPMRGPPGRVLCEELRVGGRTFEVNCLSMGNPHTVIRADKLTDELVLGTGPQIETHAAFPERTNVEFIRVLSPTEIEQRTWERGSGETLACGTGASAAAVACALNGWTERTVQVHLRGGDLEIEWAEDDGAWLTGPAEEVFEGEVAL
jgi:diaminopimelate epimerase